MRPLVWIVSLFSLVTQVHASCAISWPSVVNVNDADCWFTATSYYDIFYQFMEGTQWSKLEAAP